ncbi:MAG TPA: helix-turn-helix domain-containing protein [Candidatus Saccharimonadales bacterium]|jgi:predicted XRE-type DNA-binding protein|nr:helix-turn-helix domain-containing protein [Candidatus Saccharimonadales bacterium]
MKKKGVDSRIKAALREEAARGLARPIKKKVAGQLATAMARRKISKSQMADLLKTSRSQVDRILDAKSDVTLSSLQRVAALLGRRVVVQLV